MFAQTADFSINVQQGCVPLSGVNFTDISGGGTVTNRNWNLGNGTIIPNGAAMVGTNYLNPGTFNVTLTATFSNGAVRTVTKIVTVHPKPVAAFNSNDTIGCNPHNVSFQDLSTTATGTITNWQWDFGAGGSNVQNPNFTYTNPGNYQVSLIVRNSWSCSSDAASRPAYIRVYNRPNAGFTTSANSSCDTAFVVQFTNTTTGAGPVVYEWDFGDGSPFSNAINPSHTYTAYGVYRVRLTARIGNSCSHTVTSNFYTDIYVGKPTPSISSPDTVCVGNSIPFNGSATPAALAYQYKWHFSDNAAVNYGANVNHVFAAPGDFEVMLVTSTYYGCSDTVRKMIHVKPGPVVDFTANRLSGCSVPFTTNFTSITTPATGLAYQWNFGDGNTSTDPNPTHTYTYPFNYTVTLTVTDTSIADGCSAAIVKNSYIQIRIPTINFTFVPPVGCKPLPVVATAQIGNMIEPLDSLIWNWGDGNFDTVTNGTLTASHIYTAAGTFGIQVTLITISGCRYSSIIRNVTVIDICDDDGSGGGGGGAGGAGFGIGKTCADKYTVLFTDTVSNTIVTQWNFGDGTIVNTGTLNPISHTYAPPQTVYLVTVTRIDTLTGIISTGQKNIIIIDEKANFVPDITDICQNKRVNFNTVGIDSSKIRRYIWDFGDGTPRFIINNLNYYNTYGVWLNGNTNHTYANNGVFYVKLIIEDKLGCLDSLEYPVPISVAGPQVGFTASNLTSCDATQVVVFQDTSIQNGTTAIVEWRWNFGDGTPVYVTTVDTPITHIYNNAAYYNFRTVTLTIIDAIGCDASIAKPNYIRGYRPRADFFSYDTIRCEVYNVFLYNQSAAYNATYLWDYGDGTTSTGYYGSHTYATNGMYNIKLVVTDENGCKDSITRLSYIKIIEPVADFSIGDTSQCAPAAITFTDNSQYATSWEWDFGDGGTGSTDRNPAPHIYALPGFYQVSLYVRGVNNCVDTVRKWIRVRGPIATWNALPVLGCKPFVFNARVTGSYISTYAWDFGDGTPVNASVSDSVIAHTYLHAGKYLPNVVLISPEGCPYTLKLADSIIVDSAMANFSPQTNVFCGTGTVQFNDLSVVPSFSSINSYEWNFGDGSPASNAAMPPPHVYGPGDYTVSLIVQSQYGCRDTIVKPVAVKVNALPSGIITGDSIRCAPGTYQYGINITSTDAIQNYQWTVNGINAGTGAVLNYNFAAGNYVIGLRLTTVNNCSSFVQRSIIVDSVNADFSVIDPVRCSDDLNVNFNNLSGSHFGISNWLWNFGDNTTSIQQVPSSHTYPTYGVYNIALIATSVHGCKDTFRLAPAVTINPLPSALIAGDSIHCAPGTYPYAAHINSIDAIQTYQWTVNGINAGTNSATLNHTFAAGNYTIGLSVTTSNNCSDYIQRNIIVDSVNADFNVLNPVRCADDLSVTFNNLSGSHFGINSWSWNFGDNTTAAVQNPPAHIYPGYGNYNVMLAVNSVNGCTDTFRIQPAVIIHPMPAAAIAGDSIHCKPGAYQYAANVNSIDAIQTYQWTVNGANAGTNAATLNYNFTAGNYIIGLKVTTNNSCEDEIQKIIIVDSVKSQFLVQRPVRCGSNDLTVNFTNQSGSRFGIASYEWHFGDNQTSTAENPTHTYSLPGTYNIMLIANSVHGCTDTFRIPQGVIIYETPAVDFTGQYESCMQKRLQFTSEIVSQDVITGYAWTVNGIPAGNTAALDHLFNTAGIFVVSLTATTQNGCSVTRNKNVTIRPLPVPGAAPNTTICTGTSIMLTAQDGNSFEWSPVASLQNPLSANPVASPVATTKYYVKVTNQYGCIQYDSVLIRVDERVQLRHSPDAITCRGTAVTLTASGNSTQFVWSPAAGLNTITGTTVIANPANTTDYRVVGISSNVCPNDTGYIRVTVGDIPTVDLGPDITVNAGTQVTIPTATTGGVVGFTWTPTTGLDCAGCAQPKFIAHENITYNVKVRTQYGCEATDELRVVVLCNKGAVFIPNAFTPNNDGKNDLFFVSGYGIARVKHFSVFDRWGKQVFRRDNIQAGDRNQGWNGKVNNMDVTTTTAFVYVAEVECTEGTNIVLKGSVILIR